MAFVDFDFPPQGGPSRFKNAAVAVQPVAARSHPGRLGQKAALKLQRLLIGLFALLAMALIGSWAGEALNSALLGVVVAGVAFVSFAGVASSTHRPSGARRYRS